MKEFALPLLSFSIKLNICWIKPLLDVGHHLIFSIFSVNPIQMEQKIHRELSGHKADADNNNGS